LKPINWDELFRRNAAQLKGLCRRYTGSEATADDLVQETFITAIDKIATYKGFGSLDGWIRKIAVNKALLYLREKQINVPLDAVQQPIMQETEMELPTENRRFAIERASFTTDELLMVVDALPVHHKAVFNLYVLDGYSHQQIGKMMNISAGTSKSHLARARKKAQELLYEKAVQNQPSGERRRWAWLLFLLRPHYIDSIFKKGLGNFGIPVRAPNFTVPSPTTLTIKWTSTLAGKAVLIGGTAASIALGGYVVTQMAQSPQPDDNVKVEVTCLPVPTALVPADTLAVTASETTPIETNATRKKENVIVKKTIVVHDTIRLEKPVAK
jgi:RNA polymerase sigma factor (sigma-70 family)